MFQVSSSLNILLNSSFDGVVVFDNALNIVAMNKAVYKIFLLENTSYSCQALFEVLPLEPELQATFKQVLSGTACQIKEQSFRKSKLQLKTYFDFNLDPYFDEQNEEIVGGVMIIKDTSETKYKEKSITKKRLKDALKAFDFGNERLKYIINSCEELIMAIDSGFYITLYNEHYRNYIYQKTGKNIHIGTHLLEVFNDLPKEQEKLKRRWETVWNAKNLQIIEEENLQNQIHYYDSNFNLVINQEGKVLGGSQITRDITESKFAQQRLQESEAQKSALLHAFPDLIFYLDLTGEILNINDNSRLIPFAHSKIKGKHFGELPLPDYIKDRIEQLTKEVQQRREVIVEEFEFLLLRQQRAFEMRFIRSGKDRILVIARDTTKRRQEENRIRELLTQAQQLNKNLELQNERLALQEEQLAQANTSLVEQNEYLENTKNALLESQTQLQDTLKTLEERNFELDQFVYKTSHDLRSPLSSVLGIIHLLNIEPDSSRIPDYIRRIEGRILRLDDFIQSMLHYSRNNRSEVKSQLIHFDDLLEDCIDDLKFYKNFDQVSINMQEAHFPKNFYSDPVRIKIIFANLISNAIKYQDYEKTQRYINISVQSAQEKALLLVEDNGIGVDIAYLENIYNMFFRATEASEGSGLGLYIVKQTVDKLKGTIQIHSEGLGKGLLVRVEIPNLKP